MLFLLKFLLLVRSEEKLRLCPACSYYKYYEGKDFFTILGFS